MAVVDQIAEEVENVVTKYGSVTAVTGKIIA